MRPVDSALLDLYTARCHGGVGEGLEHFLPHDRTSFFGYGRQALAEGLRRLGVGAGDRVLLPGFICREVLASLAEVGAEPSFYPVDERLRTDETALEQATVRGTRAIVAVNYFGFPQPLEPFRHWCRRQGALLIEDNAHGFLSASDGAALGRRGDIGVFSLRKTLALPNGAALVDNRADALAPLTPGLACSGSPARAEMRYRAKAVLKRVMALTGAGGARAAVGAVRLLRRGVTGSALPPPRPDAETAMPTEAFAPLSARLLARCDVGAEQARRRLLYAWARELFANAADARPLFGDLEPSVVPQGFPFFYRGSDPEAFVRAWARRGVPVTQWPALPEAVRVSSAPGHYTKVMLVPFLW